MSGPHYHNCTDCTLPSWRVVRNFSPRAVFLLVLESCRSVTKHDDGEWKEQPRLFFVGVKFSLGIFLNHSLTRASSEGKWWRQTDVKVDDAYPEEHFGIVDSSLVHWLDQRSYPRRRCDVIRWVSHWVYPLSIINAMTTVKKEIQMCVLWLNKTSKHDSQRCSAFGETVILLYWRWSYQGE